MLYTRPIIETIEMNEIIYANIIKKMVKRKKESSLSHLRVIFFARRQTCQIFLFDVSC